MHISAPAYPKSGGIQLFFYFSPPILLQKQHFFYFFSLCCEISRVFGTAGFTVGGEGASRRGGRQQWPSHRDLGGHFLTPVVLQRCRFPEQCSEKL